MFVDQLAQILKPLIAAMTQLQDRKMTIKLQKTLVEELVVANLLGIDSMDAVKEGKSLTKFYEKNR